MKPIMWELYKKFKRIIKAKVWEMKIINQKFQMNKSGDGMGSLIKAVKQPIIQKSIHPKISVMINYIYNKKNWNGK